MHCIFLLGASKCVQTDGLSCVNTTTYQHISEIQKLTALPKIAHHYILF